MNNLPPWSFKEVTWAFVIGFVAVPIAMSLILSSLSYPTKSAFRLLIIYLASDIAWLAIFLNLTKRYGASVLTSIGLRLEKPIIQYMTDGILCGMLILVLGWLLGLLISYFHLPHQEPYEAFPKNQIWLISILAIIIAPFLEEIIFRGFLQSTLYRYMSPVFSILFTALIFMLFHTTYYGHRLALTYVGLMGLILGVFRKKTNSVIPGMVGHLLNNILAASLLIK